MNIAFKTATVCQTIIIDQEKETHVSRASLNKIDKPYSSPSLKPG